MPLKPRFSTGSACLFGGSLLGVFNIRGMGLKVQLLNYCLDIFDAGLD